jgi:hypothetical protein
MTKQGDEARPETGAVLKTGGEDSASAYASSDVPEAVDGPTLDVDRVKLVPPSQTPTVKLADLAKRAGPRAPDQMVKPKPKGPVALPEGRPLTKMQELEIDPDFLAELRRARFASEARRAGGAEVEVAEVERAAAAGATVELPVAEAPSAAPVSTAAATTPPGRRGLAMGVAVGVTVAAGVIAALRMGRETAVEPAPRESATATEMPTAAATAVPSAIATPERTPSLSTVPSAAPTSSAAPPQAIRPPGKPRSGGDDPYGATPTPSPLKTAAPALTVAPSVAPPVTTATATAPPPAPIPPAVPSLAPEPTIRPVF